MTHIIFTDPHIDKNPVANTTVKSRKRWKQFLFDNPYNLVAANQGQSICVGDLFDKTQVDAKDIYKGCQIAAICRKVLGGNHDVENSLDSYSALNLVDDMCPNIVVMPVFNDFFCTLDPEIHSLFVPHHTTKELFAKTLGIAEKLATEKKARYLFLHCNYDCEMATKETELNLSKDDAKRLLDAGFDRIFIGHDHNHKEDFGGRVIVIGSISPTSFGDCESAHGFYTLDTELNAVTYKVVWDPAERFIRLTAEDITVADPDELLDKYEQAHFFRISGEIEPTQAVEFSRALKKLWAAADKRERLFGIKVDAKIKTLNLVGDAVKGQSGVLNLKAQILAELTDSPEMLALWKEILEELTHD
jgi:DNA repair exonuclease SbcCD nuclease subunit